MPVVKPQPPPQPTPPLPLPWWRWNSDLVYPGKGSSDVCHEIAAGSRWSLWPWKSARRCLPLLPSVSQPSLPKVLLLCILLPFYLSTTTSSLNLLSGVQMPCRGLPVRVQIVLQMMNMPKWERAGGSCIFGHGWGAAGGLLGHFRRTAKVPLSKFQSACSGQLTHWKIFLNMCSVYVPLLICPSFSSSFC